MYSAALHPTNKLFLDIFLDEFGCCIEEHLGKMFRLNRFVPVAKLFDV